MIPIRSGHRRAAGALLLYLASAWVLLGDGSLLSGRRYLGGTDAFGTFWFLAWWPFALAKRLNPFLCRHIFYPQGFNMAWTPASPILALLAWPITARLGPVVSYNVLMIAGPALAAWSAYLLCLELAGQPGAAFFGGWLFGFSSYEAGLLGGGSLFLVFTPAVALLPYAAVLRYRGKIGRPGFIAAAAALLFLELGTAGEVFAAEALFWAVGLGLMFWLAAGEERRRLAILSTELLAASLLCAAAAAPYLYYFTVGRLSQAVWPRDRYVIDLANHLVPTSSSLLSGAWTESIVRHFCGSRDESGAYLGSPLLTIMIAYLYRHRDERRALWLGSLWLIIAACALGPEVHVLGRRTQIPTPWRLGELLPLMQHALPYRLTLFSWLIAAVIGALWFASAKTGLRQVRVGLAIAAAVFLLPRVDKNPVGLPAFFSSGAYKSVLKENEVVIIPPVYPYNLQTYTYQAVSGMYFRLAQGCAFDSYAVEARNWPAWHILEGKITPDYRQQLLAYMTAHHVTKVLVTPMASRDPAMGTIWEPLFDSTGWPKRRVADMAVYEVPQTSP